MGVNVKVTSYRREREAEIMVGLQKSMEQVGAIVERQAKINVSKSPPEHPQVQTGRLRSSIIHQVTKDGDDIVAEIGTNVVYSKYLEFGTSKMPAYPWLFPAVEFKRAEIITALKGKEFTVD
jgi:HK97 gp10 family phage protein